VQSCKHFAIFLDLENLAKSLEKYDKTPQELLQKILDTFVGMGKIDVARFIQVGVFLRHSYHLPWIWGMKWYLSMLTEVVAL